MIDINDKNLFSTNEIKETIIVIFDMHNMHSHEISFVFFLLLWIFEEDWRNFLVSSKSSPELENEDIWF